MKRVQLKNKKGQSLVETALVLPILLLILTGIMDFGFLFNNYLIVSNASREAARSAAVGSNDAGINNKVRSMASSLDRTRLTVTITPDETAGRSRGDSVTVKVTYKYKLITPIISAVVPGPINLTVSTTMRCE